MQERNSIHFSLHREIPDEKANRSTCRLFMPSSRWLSIRFLGSRSPWQAPLFPGLSAVLQDVGNQYVAECLYFGKSYHILLGKVTNGNLPLEHNTTLPFNIYSFALASIFLRGRTYLPILTHLVCRLNRCRERLAERPLEGRKRSESHTNFLYALSIPTCRCHHRCPALPWRMPFVRETIASFCFLLSLAYPFPSFFGTSVSFFFNASVPVSCNRCQLVTDVIGKCRGICRHVDVGHLSLYLIIYRGLCSTLLYIGTYGRV